MSQVLPSEPESILAESAWMRRLAMALLRDAAAADDVVQKTWLHALESAPDARSSTRGWLARVVRNLALKERRNAERRMRRERAVARPEAQPPADDVAARLEIHQRVLDALRALDEPYRRTLTLRYLDELYGAEIAKREGVPEGTVRWRVSRGLELLRSALDARHGGDRRAWGLALSRALGGDSELSMPIGTAALEGALAVNLVAKAAIAATLVVGAAAGVWWLAQGPRIEGPQLDVAWPSRGTDPGPGEAPRAPEGREPIPASAASSGAFGAIVATTPIQAPKPLARVSARVVDDAGAPLARATLSIMGSPSSAESDLGGRVEMETPPAEHPLGGIARVACTGFGTRWLPIEIRAGQSTQLGDVALERAASVSGRVLGPDGAPRAEAIVVVTGLDPNGPAERALNFGPNTYPGAPTTRTDALGEYRFDDVAPGLRRVWAGAPGTRFSWTEPISMEPGGEIEGVELALVSQSERDFIAGSVVDPSGQPFPRASVTLGVRSPEWAVEYAIDLDASARFRLPIEFDGPHDFRAADPEHRWPDAVVLGVMPGTDDVVLQLSEPRWIELDVRDGRGTPIEGFTVSALRASDRALITLLGFERVGAGRARCPVPTEPFVLSVFAPGYAPTACDAIDPLALPGTVSFVLEPRPGISGTVRHRGEPVTGARVTLHAVPRGAHGYQQDGLPVRMRPRADWEAITDADGRFSVTSSEIGDYVVLVHAAGFAPAERGPFRVDASSAGDALAIELDRGGSIEGRVRMPPGERAEGVIVAVNRGDTFARSMRVGEDGLFRFDLLTAGRWQVRRIERAIVEGMSSHTMVMRGGDALESDCEVVVGAVTHFDLDLSDARRCVVAGELAWAGAPATGWKVSLRRGSEDGAGDERSSTVTDERGAFELSTAEPGAYRMLFTLPADDGELTAPVELAEGTRAWRRSIDTATLVVERAPETDLSVLAWPDGLVFAARVPAGASVALAVPSGRVAIGRNEGTLGLSPGRWIEVTRVLVAAGERRVLDLR